MSEFYDLLNELDDNYADLPNEYKELFKSFENLGIEEKRNAIDNEMTNIYKLLDKGLQKYNQSAITQISKYNKNMSEAEILNTYFKNIYIIKVRIMLLMKFISNR